MRDALGSWVLRYVQAWSSNDPEAIGALFTGDAHYYTEPHAAPWVGRAAIVEGWLRHKDAPDTWGFRFEVLGVDDNVGFVRGWTEYHDEHDYSNLWVVRLDESGVCAEFVEWYIAVPDSAA